MSGFEQFAPIFPPFTPSIDRRAEIQSSRMTEVSGIVTRIATNTIDSFQRSCGRWQPEPTENTLPLHDMYHYGGFNTGFLRRTTFAGSGRDQALKEDHQDERGQEKHLAPPRQSPEENITRTSLTIHPLEAPWRSYRFTRTTRSQYHRHPRPGKKGAAHTTLRAPHPRA